MPEAPFAAAVSQVGAVLSQIPGARLLTPGDLSFYRGRFQAGWAIPNLCTDPALGLRVLLPNTAPFAAPRIAVAPAPPILAWPHLEDRGLLCLTPDAATVSIAAPGAVALTLLEDARTLVNACLAGDNIQDFEDEFTSYWGRWNRTKGTVNVLCDPRGPSRVLAAWVGSSGAYVAETEAVLRTWLRNRFGEEAVKTLTCSPVPLLWLPRPLRPTEYPATISGLRAALQEDSLPRRLLNAALMQPKPTEKLIMLGMQTRRGVALAGLLVDKLDTLQHGYRQRPPDDVVLTRYNGATTTGAVAVRFDPSWVHGRDQNPEATTLRDKRVVLIGVGSLGSGVADLLVKAGVGALTCMDSEALTSANSSRHLLGAPAVGVNKAVGVGRSLATRFPHLAIEAIAGPFQAEESIIAALRAANLIVSLCGSWPAESQLDALWRADTGLPPIVYGWAEPHAGAGHALALRHSNGCLRCVLDDMGKMHFPVTSWPASTLLQVPACGELFQPYGATELTYIQAMIAELALDVLLDRLPRSSHRVWIARRDTLARAGGAWSAAWIAMHGDPGTGGQLRGVDFEGGCAECGTV